MLPRALAVDWWIAFSMQSPIWPLVDDVNVSVEAEIRVETKLFSVSGFHPFTGPFSGPCQAMDMHPGKHQHSLVTITQIAVRIV